MNSDIPFSPHDDNRFYQGVVATWVANALQAVNFLGDRFLRQSHQLSTAIEDLYRHSMDSAFSAKESFLVTGAPHASAYYPRDFAWFYPDVLDPETIMDSQDAIRRVRLLEKSVRLMLEAVRANVVTTTIVPAGRARYLGVNYFSRPSDTLLGIIAGLQQMISADQRASSYLAMSQSAHAGRLLLAEYGADLKRAILLLASELEPFGDDGFRYLLCDASAPRSAATDTRAERRRFVTNACVYTTFVWGMQLGVIHENELTGLLGRDLAQYKKELLRLFGKGGYVRHSLDGPAGSPVSEVALDFVSVHRGFWDLSEASERALFAATTDLIIAEPRFRIPSTFHFLVSADNPRNKVIHKIAAPAYQGRSSWPTFNVEFADRMLDYDEFSGSDVYRPYAQGILKDIRTATEVHGGYQELLSEQGLKYRTWAYKGAVAHSWFPRFLSVWRRAFGTPLLHWND
ncbi:hypothetical protein JQ596_12255 [Bradyrhizobium manausense]|uniref:hypothetical protein n=1 Tax=Bradyrhizobium TaxID=374 RepID=UPI001BA9E4C7|nr:MULTISPECIES: hypothetical protein [Bradyrhizobium]MBR0826313.1 hypothetical protein [Bradyrhizobium manausense]UVO31681.1 hypothetical protein KUF59_14180 [Bradyrhizobium arachidis]